MWRMPSWAISADTGLLCRQHRASTPLASALMADELVSRSESEKVSRGS